MIEGLLVPRDYQKVSGDPFLDEVSQRLNSRPLRDQLLEKSLEPLMGPLSTANRWTTLGVYGLDSTRRNIPLDGSASTVSRHLYESITRCGYAENILMLQMIQNESSNNPEVAELAEAKLVLAIQYFLDPVSK